MIMKARFIVMKFDSSGLVLGLDKLEHTHTAPLSLWLMLMKRESAAEQRMFPLLGSCLG